MDKKYYSEAFKKGRHLTETAELIIHSLENDIQVAIDRCPPLINFHVYKPQDEQKVWIYLENGQRFSGTFDLKTGWVHVPAIGVPVIPHWWVEYESK